MEACDATLAIKCVPRSVLVFLVSRDIHGPRRMLMDLILTSYLSAKHFRVICVGIIDTVKQWPGLSRET